MHISKFNLQEDPKYWDLYYSDLKENNINKIPPSQFATFCCTELIERNIFNLVDIAAGNGRDTSFFANSGFSVYALENSTNAVNFLRKKFSKNKNVKVIETDATKSFSSKISNFNEPCAYYARFFIHVLSEKNLSNFFKNLSKVMKKTDYIFLEYRNNKDKNLIKETPYHFRNFYTNKYVKLLGKNNSLKCIYEVSGQGFAKWRNDDAQITRQIFIKEF